MRTYFVSFGPCSSHPFPVLFFSHRWCSQTLQVPSRTQKTVFCKFSRRSSAGKKGYFPWLPLSILKRGHQFKSLQLALRLQILLHHLIHPPLLSTVHCWILPPPLPPPYPVASRAWEPQRGCCLRCPRRQVVVPVALSLKDAIRYCDPR